MSPVGHSPPLVFIIVVYPILCVYCIRSSNLLHRSYDHQRPATLGYSNDKRYGRHQSPLRCQNDGRYDAEGEFMSMVKVLGYLPLFQGRNSLLLVISHGLMHVPRRRESGELQLQCKSHLPDG